ncbi:MAG: hypothetical protein E7Z77_00760 [Methanobrevibacter sp.]|uniref:hypothetical protein n=1 Tax=Methanobrevibacter sp. TaxID=66852 RepID=UPI0025F5BCA0|nr:hypothetical protein [Methanobrevibacter sp.]MBE6507922.1 hypothetical protein [Methanobrevibacter sp.]
MARQAKKSEQITPSLSLVYDYDQKLTKISEFESAFKDALGNIEVVKYKNHRIYKYTHNNHDTYFLTGAITWLSNPHPLFKKRLQLKKWYKEVYEEYNFRENSDVRIVGIYRYDGMHIFVEFDTEDYMGNKLNSSSAHVYSNDLYQALTNEYFTKRDQKGNTITTISSRNFKKYIDESIVAEFISSGQVHDGDVQDGCVIAEYVSSGRVHDGDVQEGGVVAEYVSTGHHTRPMKNSIFDLFAKFNNGFSFGKWITAVSAIEKMKSKRWYQWKGTEWAGWFLECEMNEFIENEQCQDTMIYIGNKKTDDLLDFDLYFKNDDFYGDLKASDINKKEAPGNDQNTTLEAINYNGKLWYVIYEHETKKDVDYNSEMAISRMELIGTPYQRGSKISYQTRMKHSVNFKKMEILELNRINMHEVLRNFNQGRNSDGNERNVKFIINKSNIDNFIIYSYEPD